MEMVRAMIKEMGFRQSRIDHLVFYCHAGEEHTIIVVATDNMAVTSKRMVDTEKFKSIIKTFWDITDHGPLQ